MQFVVCVIEIFVVVAQMCGSATKALEKNIKILYNDCNNYVWKGFG